VFGPRIGSPLTLHAETPIQLHVKVQGDAQAASQADQADQQSAQAHSHGLGKEGM
jgi:hypothetical protein